MSESDKPSAKLTIIEPVVVAAESRKPTPEDLAVRARIFEKFAAPFLEQWKKVLPIHDEDDIDEEPPPSR